MSYQPVGGKNKKEAEVTDALMGALEFVAKLAMWVGLAATLVSAGLLIYYVIVYSGGTPPSADPKGMIETFRKILTTGLLAFFIGSAYLFWGEGWMEIVQIIVSVLFFLAPQLGTLAMPSIATSTSGIPLLALVAIRTSAMGAGIV